MPSSMTRGKNQILYNYLPERTIEFPKGAAIARITQILGTTPHDLNHDAVVRRIATEARAWREEWRPALRDQVLNDPNRFELIDPESARSELFPKVFWCQNRACGRVFDYSNSDRVPRATCTGCNDGQLVQMRFVKIHNCGHLEPLAAPRCNNCSAGSTQMALDTRGSERMINFRWVCRDCGRQTGLFAGFCPACPTTMRREERVLDIQLHRAGKAYCAHTTTLLNIPHGQLQGLFARPESDWAAQVAAKFLGLPEVASKRLTEMAGTAGSDIGSQGASVSAEALASLTARMQAGEITAEDMAFQIQQLTQQAQDRSAVGDPSELRTKTVERTGVVASVWTGAGYDLLESILPDEGVTSDVSTRGASDPTRKLASRLGFERLQLLSDFPIITATYGYSRSEYDPNRARLNPFPPDPRRGGKFPVFVDKVQADAIRIRLNGERLLGWLCANDCQPDIPHGTDQSLSVASYFVRLFDEAELRTTIRRDRELRMVFTTLHTLCHLGVRQAALLCGLERTSLSEYILPRSLDFILYCNHREGATIGALTAMFEQSLFEWLGAIREARRCVYDPVCSEKDSTCHACTHLAETSCRFFNLNLSRALLFGGRDKYLGDIDVGYLDFLP
nr:hypothetical protein 1 [Pseudomonadaceae bacterium]